MVWNARNTGHGVFKQGGRLYKSSLAASLPPLKHEPQLIQIDKQGAMPLNSYQSIHAVKQIHSYQPPKVRTTLPPIHNSDIYRSKLNPLLRYDIPTMNRNRYGYQCRNAGFNTPQSDFSESPLRLDLSKTLVESKQIHTRHDVVRDDKRRTMKAQSRKRWKVNCACLRCRMMQDKWKSKDSDYAIWGEYPCEKELDKLFGGDKIK
ncbi:unnamed protein product [Owenia fusiformis]|uniref:Uncharacterized protein n=1 Tax=Owenia fusiformis TaxID=6347 RepID=A0A8J1TY18_OWEFU|nr:unnamed protein product [Owenia fusiformis]